MSGNLVVNLVHEVSGTKTFYEETSPINPYRKKILESSKLKASANEKIKSDTKEEKFIDSLENIVGQRGNVVCRHFSFPQNVMKAGFVRVVKALDCVVKKGSKLELTDLKS